MTRTLSQPEFRLVFSGPGFSFLLFGCLPGVWVARPRFQLVRHCQVGITYPTVLTRVCNLPMCPAPTRPLTCPRNSPQQLRSQAHQEHGPWVVADPGAQGGWNTGARGGHERAAGGRVQPPRGGQDSRNPSPSSPSPTTQGSLPQTTGLGHEPLARGCAPPRASAPAQGPTTRAEPTLEGAECRDWSSAAAVPRPQGGGPRPAPASPDRSRPAAAASRRPSPG